MISFKLNFKKNDDSPKPGDLKKNGKSKPEKSKGAQAGTPRKKDILIPYVENTSKTLVKNNGIENDLYVKHDVKRGLRNSNGTGVVVGLTRIGAVDGYKINEKNEKVAVEGKLYYRGYDVEDLVKNVISEDRFGFEETSYLLLFGELPNKKQLAEFTELLGSHRELPVGFARDMIMTAPSANIMNKLARSVLALYSYDPTPDDLSIPNVLRQSIELMGHFPPLVSYAYQAKKSYFDNESMHIHNPLPELSTAENILRMTRPTGEFTKLEARLLDISLMLHAEHGGGNNSTFATHLLSSTDTDTYSVIAAAIGSLKGPKHGGANAAVLNMILDLKKNVKDITNHKDVEKYLIRVLKGEANDGSGLIYGLGHAVYTISDPRAAILKGMAKELAVDKHLLDDFMLCDFIEKRAPSLYKEVKGTDKPMPANVDLYSGFVYNALNIPIDISTPLFATARLSGWCAHRMEELIAGKRLIRPAYICVQKNYDYTPIGKRK
ncbi:MAG: citrate/2-methylcitrate synthase [Clostridiales bacterium]|nr:citrate/2-methylcitrate synthase [Clostridiales bacterium]